MASTNLLVFRGLRDPDRRLGVALLASALLHALMLLSLWKNVDDGRVFNRPVHAPLSVRLERVVPEPAEAMPIVIDSRKGWIHQKPALSAPGTAPSPADIEPSWSQPGVSVSEVMYVRPIPSRASSPLLANGEYRRTSDISEKPEAVAIRVPKYPRSAREQEVSGWVIVMLFVDEEGKVVDTAAVESSESFDDYASDVAQALRGSTFTPGKLAGQAVKTLMFARVGFDSKALSSLDFVKGSSGPASTDNKEKR
jgi:hypothetical protein